MTRIMGTLPTLAFAMSAIIMAPCPAAADPCAGERILGAGPVQASLHDGQLGLARQVCPVSEIGVAGSGLAVMDLDNFYGQIRVAAQVWGNFMLSEDTELFALMEIYRYQTVISSISAESSGIGHTALGATHRLLTIEDFAWGLNSRIVLPTSTDLYSHAYPIGADLGTNAEYRILDWLAAHGQLSLLFSAAVSRAGAHPRFGAILTAGVSFQPFDSFAVVADTVTSFGYTDALDYFSASVALRLNIVAGLTLSLDAILPLAGRERALAAGALRVIWQPQALKNE